MQITRINIYTPSFYGEYADRVSKIEDNNSFFSKAYWNAEETVEKEMKQEILEYQTWAASREGEVEGLRRTLDESKKNHSTLLNLKKTQLKAIENKISSNEKLSKNLNAVVESQQQSIVQLDKTISSYGQTKSRQQKELISIEKNIEEIDRNKSEYTQKALQDLETKLEDLKVKHLEQLSQLDLDLNNLIVEPNKMQETLKRPKENGFGSIAGYKAEKDAIQNFFGEPVVLNQFGEDAKIPNGILFFGPDENRNQNFVTATANQYNCNLIKIDNLKNEEEVIEKLYEATEITTENFEINNQQSIIFIPEFDKKVTKDSVITETIKSLLDDISSEYHATIFATSTNPDKIDDILLRDGRFDLKLPIEVRFSINDFIEILKHHLKPNILSEINLDNYAEFLFISQLKGAFSIDNIKSILENIVPTIKDANLITFEKQKILFRRL